MGRDKALLPFCGRPMVEIAVEKLHGFCAEVSIAGNRDDLASFAPVVRETRLESGPAAGIEAGLTACEQRWALFVPVDVPLVPRELLRRWASEVLRGEAHGLTVSHLLVDGDQPTFCMLRRDLATLFTEVLEGGERKLTQIFHRMEAGGGFHWGHDMSELYEGREYPSHEEIEQWFLNVNTADEWLTAERWLAEQRASAHGE
jgi:molybdopterin-guanine dinucleotide biosynthesis protein A